jgi:hypothetical protein
VTKFEVTKIRNRNFYHSGKSISSRGF